MHAGTARPAKPRHRIPKRTTFWELQVVHAPTVDNLIVPRHVADEQSPMAAVVVEAAGDERHTPQRRACAASELGLREAEETN
jgi:hypothetical protein